MEAVLLLLCTLVPQESAVLKDRVDAIELNHYYNEKGEYIFGQLILWDFGHPEHERVVVDWCYLLDQKEAKRRPFEIYGDSAVVYRDDFLYHIRAGSVYTTWTQYDPESANRAIFHLNNRRKLPFIKRRR